MPSQPTSPLHLKPSQSKPFFWQKFNLFDSLFAVAVVALFFYGAMKTRHLMDSYEVVIFVLTALSIICLSRFWPVLKLIFVLIAGLSLISIFLYQGQLDRADTVFALKYVLASQPAVLWMSTLFLVSTVLYWAYSFSNKSILGWLASCLNYAALVLGVTALMVRWHESYLIAPDIGYIPVSSLYEVFILFSLLTTAFYLYYEERYQTQQLGGFVMLVVCSAVGFLLWYSITRGAQEIKPLIPALQSWWMKIHVPANFVGYGTFSIAAMVGFAYIIKFLGTSFTELPLALQAGLTKEKLSERKVKKHAVFTRYIALVLWFLGAALFLQPLLFRSSTDASYFANYWLLYFAAGLVFVGAILLAKKQLAYVLPSFQVLDDVMYKAISVGFVFFTIATILGALWAADAWGKYWSWDPKETWALIVWLNYAAWLHLRLVAGLRGLVSAFWALVGLLITGFAFLGVNMFLSGLHSYGAL